MEDILYKLYENLPLPGPGCREATIKVAQSMKKAPVNPVILDLGCGSGMQTMEIVKYFGGTVFALDNHKHFLEQLEKNSKMERLDSIIKCTHADMFNPPFEDEYFDIIFAEGSIYIDGFEKSLNDYRRLLKKGGYFALTEGTWLKENPPLPLGEYWIQGYPDIKTIRYNLNFIENCDYTIIDSFILAESAWWDDYYHPLEKEIKNKLTTLNNDKNVLSLLQSIQVEIDVYRQFSAYYGYVFCVLQK
jgi:ubiquinone/menaquinone biosynthesis C-methylase UbiE